MTSKRSLNDLEAIMEQLRSPDGCPWDKEQDFTTLIPCITEEAYEVIDAIDRLDIKDPIKSDNLKEELGDLLFQIVFVCQLGKEEELFNIDDVIDAVAEKMIRRHPHVFGNEAAKSSLKTPKEVLKQWGEIKDREKEHAAITATDGDGEGYLSDVPRSFPALLRAKKVSKKAAKVGFDWEKVEEVLAKVDEEVEEFKEALQSGDKTRMEAELGDILFALTNLGRFIDIDPEEALRKTIKRFINRFHYIELELTKAGSTLSDATLEEMETLWNKAKRYFP